MNDTRETAARCSPNRSLEPVVMIASRQSPSLCCVPQIILPCDSDCIWPLGHWPSCATRASQFRIRPDRHESAAEKVCGLGMRNAMTLSGVTAQDCWGVVES
jgi:hypothetical protein